MWKKQTKQSDSLTFKKVEMIEKVIQTQRQRKLIYPLRKEKEEIKVKSEIQAEEIEVAETSDEPARPDEILRLSRWLLNLSRVLLRILILL